MASLIHEIAHCKDLAERANLHFASRLLDMCLLEVAMEWEGRGRTQPLGDEEMLIVLLRSKLKVAMTGRNKAVSVGSSRQRPQDPSGGE
ncbi:hypothetical protein [Jiella sonneratiae]|uniref:Uncharacterized protein n=1 Tax=Jiella sonneratiae TaxID=2816856 RepID=A0ABS3J4B0_9HYPH|nr:hypothetical protein [Jiella sonneratiae]MBO0904515.1 hypothetical protein [Jiella sonneratiae]